LSARFEIVEHTADVGIRAWGDDLKEVFEAAAKGMVSIVVDSGSVKERVKREIGVEAENIEELLIKWLREILFSMEREGVLYSQIEVKEANFYGREGDSYRILGDLSGERLNMTRHGICTEIKAVTRHGFFLKRRKRGWEAQILFDV
jgi:SHS2 domain-containing protein